MADTTTENYGFVKPEPGASEDTWGEKLNSNWDGIDGVAKDLQTQINSKAAGATTISAGAGLTGGGNLTANRTISHADTSSQASVNNSGKRFIQDVTLDTYGHVTGLVSADAPDPPPVVPAGTRMLFQQTAAPTGWTKETTHNNKALRVVSGTAGTGGSVAFTTAFASKAVSGSVGNTTLTTSQIPAHKHSFSGTTSANGGHSHTHWAMSGASGRFNDGGGSGDNHGETRTTSSVSNHTHTLSGSTSNAGSGGAHNHSFSGTAINMAVQYVDLIIARKN